MHQSRPLFVIFVLFIIISSIIQIEKSAVGVLRTWIRGCRMVGADETTDYSLSLHTFWHFDPFRVSFKFRLLLQTILSTNGNRTNNILVISPIHQPLYHDHVLYQRPLYTWICFQYIIPPFLMHLITQSIFFSIKPMFQLWHYWELAFSISINKIFFFIVMKSTQNGRMRQWRKY